MTQAKKAKAVSELCSLIQSWLPAGLSQGDINSVLASVLDMRLKCEPEAKTSVDVNKSKDIVRLRLVKILGEHLGIHYEEIKDTDHVVNDLGADSLDTIEILMSVEDEFQSDIDDDVADQHYIVGDIVNALYERLMKEEKL